ncbi:MAG: patatin-like phospholipase family protein [Pseudobdellovibrionaceae bacterium]
MKKLFGTTNRVSPSKSQEQEPIKIGLALSGGASHGQYQAEALIQLLNSDLIRSGRGVITHVTGTSAGANNGARLVAGLNAGGPEEAARLLKAHWKELGAIGRMQQGHIHAFNVMALHDEDKFPNIPRFWNLTREMMNAATPNGLLPTALQYMLERDIVDWKHVQQGPCQLFVNACSLDPNAPEGLKHHIFTGEDLTPETITASAALREFGGVRWRGETLYDGGYYENPHFEIIQDADIDHMIFVMLDPEAKSGATQSAQPPLERAFRKVVMNVDKTLGDRLAALEANPERSFDIHRLELQSQPHWNKTTFYRLDPAWMSYLRNEAKTDFAGFARSNPDLFPEHDDKALARHLAA